MISLFPRKETSDLSYHMEHINCVHCEDAVNYRCIICHSLLCKYHQCHHTCVPNPFGRKLPSYRSGGYADD